MDHIFTKTIQALYMFKADPSQLPFLLLLWEDESEVVRTTVTQALEAFGADLEGLLSPFWKDMPVDQVKSMQEMCHQLVVKSFEESWLSWLEIQSPSKALARALSLLAFLEHGNSLPSLENRVDLLEAEFKEKGREASIEEILHFLFVEKRFGSPCKDPFHPHNAHPIMALETGEAFPIGLVCLAILLGDRVGVVLRGFHTPGHYLLLDYHERGVRLFDPFNRGRQTDASATKFHLESFRRTYGHERALHASNFEIVLEILRQTATGYARESNLEKVRFYSNLYDQLLHEVHERNLVH